VQAGLISGEQAQAIASFEAAHAEAPARRTPLVTEALAYLGGALALAAGLVALGRVWDDMAPATRASWLAVGAVAALVAGAVVRSADPAIRRVGRVLWLVSAGLADAVALVVMLDVLERDGPEAAFWAFAAGSAYAAILYGLRRTGLQQVAIFGAVAPAVGSAAAWAAEAGAPPLANREGSYVGFAILALGIAWLAVGWIRVVEPERVAFVLGSSAGLVGSLIATGDAEIPASVIGLAFALSLLAASVVRRSNVLLGFGAAGTFLMLVSLIVRVFEDTLGVPIALLLSGAVLLVVALGTARLKRVVGSGA
jgi:hypothetical protein